jgi:hypothetical protein
MQDEADQKIITEYKTLPLEEIVKKVYYLEKNLQTLINIVGELQNLVENNLTSSGYQTDY